MTDNLYSQMDLMKSSIKYKGDNRMVPFDYSQIDPTGTDKVGRQKTFQLLGRILLVLALVIIIAWLLGGLISSAPAAGPSQSMNYFDPPPVPAPHVMNSELQVTPQPWLRPAAAHTGQVPAIAAPRPVTILQTNSN